jgi:hypothetical protein
VDVVGLMAARPTNDGVVAHDSKLPVLEFESRGYDRILIHSETRPQVRFQSETNMIQCAKPAGSVGNEPRRLSVLSSFDVAEEALFLNIRN